MEPLTASRSIVFTILALIILLSASMVPAKAQPVSNSGTIPSVTRIYEVGGGETAKTSRLLRKLLGARAVGEATPPVSIRSLGARLIFSGPVEDASRVEAYLKLPPPRLPRLVEIPHRRPSEIARTIETATEETGLQDLVLFPDDGMGSLYLIASSEKGLDAGEVRIRELDSHYSDGADQAGPGREGRSWTDYVKIGGDIRFDTTWYRGLGGQDYNIHRARTTVGVEVGGENIRGRVGVRGEESRSR